MNYLELNEQVSASGQLGIDDIDRLSTEKVELLVCNRPDDEDEGQLPYETIAAAAKEKGIETRLLAFSSYQIQNEDRDKLIEILKENKRTHLYCRSGARSKRLWRMANKIGCGGHNFEPVT
ncbi:MAG: sulfur transferase domain-containing protein [Gammaproteobacteria bacterium]|nr:sulfur transferase domain-containing protein [Gammaproteobacteria bacterium]